MAEDLKPYEPKPIDTVGVRISSELSELIEKLAENVHELWARQRIADGWVLGPERDDQSRRHPCLIPYDQLPELEKDYDRIIVRETILALLALGYGIGPSGAELKESKIVPGSEIARNLHGQALRTLENPVEFDLRTAAELWRRRHENGWSDMDSPDVYRRLADEVLRLGEPLLAYDVAAEGLVNWSKDQKLRQVMALALMRSGATKRGLAILEELIAEGKDDEETLGMVGRAHKDLAEQTQKPEDRLAHYTAAYKKYLQSYEIAGGYWAGINAASMARIMGDRRKSLALATRIRELCEQEKYRLREKGEDLYWITATLAEAALLCEDFENSMELYRDATGYAGQKLGNLGSTRRQMRLIAKVMKLDPSLRENLESCFGMPRVVVFSGHMVDLPDRPSPRFPSSIENAVKQDILDRLNRINGRIGFSSAACGSDILFLESILELGGQIHIVLPYEKEEFVRSSVEIAPIGSWKARFEHVLANSTEVIVASQYSSVSATSSLDYANRLLFGLAKIRAEQLQTDMVPLAVWDGQAGQGEGGTASTVRQWKSKGIDVEVIDIQRLLPETSPLEQVGLMPPQPEKPSDIPSKLSGFETRLAAILFADAVGFSKLNEGQIPLFVNHVWGPVSKLFERFDRQPLFKSTWGDGLYLIFDGADLAGRFAMAFKEHVDSTDWPRLGFDHGISFRIALHAGPVHQYVDPFTGKSGFTGMHVTRAARIEPITPPGEIYSTREFAAMAASENTRAFACDYVGIVPLAKKYSDIQLFHLRPSDRTAL